MEYPIRINKYLREKGLASRKEADQMIAAGLILINGKRAELGIKILETDKVTVKEAKSPQRKIYLAYFKPRGLSTQDLKGAPSVITEWAKKGLYPIGRLDKESEGLLILTNDGRAATSVLGAESNFEKEYVVKVQEKLRAGIAAIFNKGMDTKTFGKLLPARARLRDNHTMEVVLREGRRHQLRVMLAELGYTVTAIKRFRVGPILLADLKPGQSRSLDVQEISALLPRLQI